MDSNIKNKVVVITGASSGLGEATALELADHGAKVVLVARRSEKIEFLAKNIQSKGGDSLAITADVTDLDDLHNVVNKTIEHYGHIDVFINNAGIMLLSPIERVNINDWKKMVDVNINGVLNGVAAVLPHMIERNSGHIINTASVAAHKINHNSAVYSMTKAAVRTFSEGLRMEMTPYKIRTTVISPGAVQTELSDHINEQDIQAANKQYVSQVGVHPSSFARTVIFAVSQPDDVDINEILYRPTAQEG